MQGFFKDIVAIFDLLAKYVVASLALCVKKTWGMNLMGLPIFGNSISFYLLILHLMFMKINHLTTLMIKKKKSFSMSEIKSTEVPSESHLYKKYRY